MLSGLLKVLLGGPGERCNESQPQSTVPVAWFGGKSRVADLVWDRFGNVPNYVEPFFGSGAVLLGRPHEPGIETVNDLDGFVANFWRAVQTDPEQVAEYADWPVNENDLHARHAWLVTQRSSLTSRLEGEPAYFDAKIAGWWVWGMAAWIGGGFCSGAGPWIQQEVAPGDWQLVNLGGAGLGVNRKRVHLGNSGVNRQLVHLGRAGQGVNKKLVNLGNAGRGVNRQRVHLGPGRGVNRKLGELIAYFSELQSRLRKVRVCSGDWSRVCGPTPTFKQGLTGVFLDPPYSDEAGRDSDIYAKDSGDVAHEVREWAIANGDNPLLRIALCGYEGEHAMPEDWECVWWKASGGYGSQGETIGRENSKRERIYFSPACMKTTLFAAAEKSS